MKKYILTLDQGTTSSRAILFDREQNIIDIAQKEFTQHYPQSGYVEHDAMEIFASQSSVVTELLARTGISAGDIAAIGITNQRETTIVWDKHTGQPVYNAIVWQCRRTADICENLKKQGHADYIKATTGLVIDAYFSGTKIKWILDHVPGARQKAEKGDLLFGTVDSWLIWKLTNGALHITDYTNASRTMIFDIHNLCWDEKLLSLLDIPAAMLPEVRSSGEVFGHMTLSGHDIPIAGIAGDQQAALFGQTCFARGDAKNTYGTGCFLLMNTGDTPCESQNGLLTTLAATPKGQIQYALEGSVFTGGAIMQWLRDEMHLIERSQDAGPIATQVVDTGGVYIVPAFTGLGAPHWDMYARGTIVGITRGTNRAHIVRAAEEAIAYQSADLLEAMKKDAGIPITDLRVDGGASADNFLMQFQTDILGIPVLRPRVRETTSLGAAYLAGLAVDFWSGLDEIRAASAIDKTYTPAMNSAKADSLRHGWNRAVQRSLDWIEQDS